MVELQRLDALLQWMRDNGVKYAAIDGLVLELDQTSAPETPLTQEQLERLRHLREWQNGAVDVEQEYAHPALNPELWPGGRVPADVKALFDEVSDA